LNSVFEAWMLSEHHSRGYPTEFLTQIFANSNFGNGIVAIIAGFTSSFLIAHFGFIAPFILSFLCLLTSAAQIVYFWPENYGNQDMLFGTIFSGVSDAMLNDIAIPLLAIIQSLFEASLYVFVVAWTPVLTSFVTDLKDSSGIHGLVFSCFMVCLMLGGGLFTILHSFMRTEIFYKYTLLVAAICFFFAAGFKNGYTSFIAFVVFEICCGIHYPSVGILRSKYIPESSRSAVMNFFRIPLNLLVVAILKWLISMDWPAAFLVCGCWLVISALLLHILTRVKKIDLIISSDSDWVAKEVHL